MCVCPYHGMSSLGSHHHQQLRISFYSTGAEQYKNTFQIAKHNVGCLHLTFCFWNSPPLTLPPTHIYFMEAPGYTSCPTGDIPAPAVDLQSPPSCTSASGRQAHSRVWQQGGGAPSKCSAPVQLGFNLSWRAQQWERGSG